MRRGKTKQATDVCTGQSIYNMHARTQPCSDMIPDWHGLSPTLDQQCEVSWITLHSVLAEYVRQRPCRPRNSMLQNTDDGRDSRHRCT